VIYCVFKVIASASRYSMTALITKHTPIQELVIQYMRNAKKYK